MHFSTDFTGHNMLPAAPDLQSIAFAIQSAGFGMWDVQPAGEHITCDARCRELLGITKQDDINYGKAIEYIHTDDRDNIIEAVQCALDPSGDGAFNVVCRTSSHTNPMRWVRFTGKRYCNDAGVLCRFAGVIMDVTAEKIAALNKELIWKDAEEQLLLSARENEARFKDLIKEAPYAMAVFIGRELIVDVANEAIIRLWGKNDSVIGMPLHLAVPELIGQPFLKILDDVYTSGITYHAGSAKADLEVNGILSSFYFNFTYQPLKNKQGKVYGILDMAVDVSEQVLARKKLEESALFTRSVIQHSPVAKAVFVGDDMVIQTANERMLAIMGRDESIIGMPLMKAMPELVPTPLAGRLLHVFKTGETYYQPEEKLDIMLYGKPHSGYYNYIYKALLDTSGEIYGIICTATEVTDMVLTRQKIEEAEALLRVAIDLSEMGTWSVNLETGIADYSGRLRSWFGFEDDEVITFKKIYGKIKENIEQDFSEPRKRALDPAIRSVYETEFTVVNQETGRTRIIQAQGKAFFNEKNIAFKVTGIARDVTEQRKTQLALEQEVKNRTEELRVINAALSNSNERLIHSNEELEQYAYVTSHDLQEPLRKIRTYSGMLENKVTMPEEGKQLLDKIISSAGRMSMLIQDLLEFSRLLKSEKRTRPIALSEVCKAIINDFELSIEEKGAEVQIGSLPVIEAVGLQMNQLFYNLMSNALKFSKPGVKPIIKIFAKRLHTDEVKSYFQRPQEACDYFQITFTDNGIGFDVIYAEQIFEVFKRLHGRNTYPGSGIGLALCRRIVTNHNGYMYAVSEPGQGAAFHIILPEKI